MHDRKEFFIGGSWVEPSGTQRIDVISPSTEAAIGSVPEGLVADVDRAVEAARAAFDHGPWPTFSPDERADVLERIADGLAQRADELTDVITASAGFPITQTRQAHVLLPQFYLRYAAQLARATPLHESRAALAGGTLTIRQAPVGVVGAIVPWNIPLLGAVSKLAAVWAAGCTAVLKPSPETPLDAFILAEIVDAAGIPPGVLNIVPGGTQAGERLVSHPGVDKITFTGSSAVGKRIAAACAPLLKPVALELGGNAPAVVLDDIPAEQVANGIVRAAIAVNNGQACVAQTRVITPARRESEIAEALAVAASALAVGDPFEESTVIGPVITDTHRQRICELMDSGRADGARVLCGGMAPDGLDRGWYVAPTVFSGVRNDMRIAREEIFGPVVTVIAVESEAEALAVANDTEYGLSGSVWSSDPARATGFGRQINAGHIWINDSFTLDPAAPFGGWKESGFGREGGPEGLHEYLQTQTLFGAPTA